MLVVNLQLRLMVVAGDAQTLGAALNHASLNVANALGAWLGGVVIAAGLGLPLTGPGRRRAVRWSACSCWRCRSACIVARASPDPCRSGADVRRQVLAGQRRAGGDEVGRRALEDDAGRRRGRRPGRGR